jgi:hypothetical protein
MDRQQGPHMSSARIVRMASNRDPEREGRLPAGVDRAEAAGTRKEVESRREPENHKDYRAVHLSIRLRRAPWRRGRSGAMPDVQSSVVRPGSAHLSQCGSRFAVPVSSVETWSDLGPEPCRRRRLAVALSWAREGSYRLGRAGAVRAFFGVCAKQRSHALYSTRHLAPSCCSCVGRRAGTRASVTTP